MKWNLNVQHIGEKFRKKLWSLRRIKSMGGSIRDMLLVYKVQIRPVTEIACPSWNGALTKENIENLEKLQKLALKIILESKYTSYQNALKILKLTTLKERRDKLCLSFARKTEKNEKYRPWFKKTANTRSNTQFTNNYARTSAYQKSPIPYLVNLLNK